MFAEIKTINNRHPDPPSTVHLSSYLSPPPSETFPYKAGFPLAIHKLYFVLYKSISGRPNSLKRAQEGLQLLRLQKVCFICFILSFKRDGSDSHCSSALSATMSVMNFQAIEMKKHC
jgi:hypothetical protein